MTENLCPRRTLSPSPPNSTQTGIRLANLPVPRLPKQDLQARRPPTKTSATLSCTDRGYRCAGGNQTIWTHQRNWATQSNQRHRGSWANGSSTSVWTCQKHFYIIYNFVKIRWVVGKKTRFFLVGLRCVVQINWKGISSQNSVSSVFFFLSRRVNFLKLSFTLIHSFIEKNKTEDGDWDSEVFPKNP